MYIEKETNIVQTEVYKIMKMTYLKIVISFSVNTY